MIFTNVKHPIYQNQKILNQSENYKAFQFNSVFCQYKNTNKTIFSNTYSPTLLISNFLATQQGHQILKTTQIKLFDKIIILQDVYSIKNQSDQIDQQQSSKQEKNCQNPPSHIFQNEQQKEQSQSDNKFLTVQKSTKKFIMPKKDHHQVIVKNGKKVEWNRQTKNIPRNIMRAFMKSIQAKDIQQGKQFFDLFQSIGYNNSLVQMVINDLRMREKLKQFLQDEGNHWLNASRIKDKESHLEAMGIYLQKIKKIEDLKLDNREI